MKNIVSLIDFIIRVAENVIKMQDEDNSIPRGGHNGPYLDPETPVRNSSHWIMTFSKCYELTRDKRFKKKVFELAEYLYSKDARPYGYSFYHRNKKGKDRCNGLVGQAWSIEALVEASKILEDDKYILLAEDVFIQHPFNEKYGIWHRLEIDGEVLGIDGTFNHQLWFAACASLIESANSDEIIKKVKTFLHCLAKNLIVLENGLIFHLIDGLPMKLLEDSLRKVRKRRLFLDFLKIIYKEIFTKSRDKKENYREIIYKSIGYHSFNTYALALLKSQIPTHYFWRSGRLNKIVNYILTDEYKTDLSNNNYGYPYNLPGFEVPYSLSILSDMNIKELIKISQFWVNEQIRRSYDKNTGMMGKNTYDPLTNTARIYEITRLPNEILEKIRITSL